MFSRIAAISGLFLLLALPLAPPGAGPAGDGHESGTSTARGTGETADGRELDYLGAPLREADRARAEPGTEEMDAGSSGGRNPDRCSIRTACWGSN